MSSIPVVLFCLIFPAFALWLKDRKGILAKLSPIIVCYAAGLIVGNVGILPQGSMATLDLLSTAAVGLSIPLLLFSVDIRRWKELRGKTGLAFILACIAVMAVSTCAHFIFRDRIPDSAKVAGMLVGVYTGGTPNLAAIKTALGVDMTVYLAVNGADIVLSSVYFLFVLTVAQKVFGHIMPAYKAPAGAGIPGPDDNAGLLPEMESATFKGLFGKGFRKSIAGAAVLDVAIVAVGMGVSMLVPREWQTMTAILAVTTLSLASSMSKRVRSIPGTFAAGEYVLYVFCLAVGAMGDFRVLMGAAPEYFLYVALVLFGSFLLHAVLCALFKVDVDTMLVVSTATINSPPFVGLACVALKNRNLLVPGITTGIIGYAVGNYLGIALASILGG
ncbi:MAG: DUF819 family protein [Rectinemataceae bacterium]